MNATRHTMGPWKPEYAGYNDMDGNFDIETVTIRGAGNLVVAKVEPHHASVADVIANANVVAAAPEVLAALRALTDTVDLMPASWFDRVPRLHADLQRARKAIAEADGETR